MATELPRVTGGVTAQGAHDPGILYDNGLLTTTFSYEPKYRRRGRLVHLAGHLIAESVTPGQAPTLAAIEDEWWGRSSGSVYHVNGQYIDDKVEHEECRPYLIGIVNAIRENDIQVPNPVEREVISRRLNYKGHIDWDCVIRASRVVLDIKTGAKAPWHPIQSALYTMAYTEEIYRETKKVILFRRYVLYCGSSWGKSFYKLVEHTDQYDFKAAENFARAWHDRQRYSVAA